VTSNGPLRTASVMRPARFLRKLGQTVTGHWLLCPLEDDEKGLTMSVQQESGTLKDREIVWALNGTRTSSHAAALEDAGQTYPGALSCTRPWNGHWRP
jgi:hypothetical protein